jgi:hypothetical protein
MKKSNHWPIATGVALLLLSYIFWQWRYEKLSENLVADDVCQHAQHWQGMTAAPTVSFSDDGLVIRKHLGGASSSIYIQLGELRDARHIAVACDVAWEDCQKDPKVFWAMPRIVLVGSDAAGHFFAPSDHGIVTARGTRKWHREHCVMELPTHIKNPRISIDAYGIQGTLRVKHLRVEIVRSRVWAEATGMILFACWIIWLAWNLRPFLQGRWCIFRSLLLGAALSVAFATFVFPQPRSLERSLGMPFWLGVAPPRISPAVEATKEPSIVVEKIPRSQLSNPSSQPKRIRLRTIPPPLDDAHEEPPRLLALPSAPVPTPAPVVIAQPTPWEVWRASAREQLLEMDRRWNFRSYNLTHFTSFFATSLCVLLLARRTRLLWLVAAMAVSAEIIPDLVHDVGDSGDFYDLLANALGIVAALLLYRAIRLSLFKRRQSIEMKA